MNIWEGIYDDFKSCPVEGLGHLSTRWRDRSEAKLNLLRAQTDTVPHQNEAALAQLISTMDKSLVSVLDVGGNLGFSYIHLKRACSKPVRYSVMELPNICAIGCKEWAGHSDIEFVEQLPVRQFDVLYMSNSLQYFDDWRGFLSLAAASTRPQYILLANLFAGDIPTYATIQNYYESKMASWFFNVQEIISHISLLGFDLVFKTAYTGQFLSVYQDVPMDNLPQSHRIKNICTLLFEVR